ncbi:MAG TPA: adenylate/guanylate cyclase domain-containing protein [Gaiellaceae bacterium]
MVPRQGRAARCATSRSPAREGFSSSSAWARPARTRTCATRASSGDFTALGDVVNVAARLQARAEPSQLLVSERVYEVVRDGFPAAGRVELELKGKAVPVAAHVIEVASSPLATAAR